MIHLDATYGPTFRSNDRLFATDLTDWQEAPLRGLARHFRSLHRYWGVANGMQVKANKDGDAWTITVAPGTAYDSYGRPLCLTAPVIHFIQADLDSHVVLVRGVEPTVGTVHGTALAPQECDVVIEKVRLENGVVASPRGWEVPLARLMWSTDEAAGFTMTLDESCRVKAGNIGQPFLATGAVAAGTTATPLAAGNGLQLWVDTRRAGFLPPSSGREAPVYLVTVGRPTLEDAALLMSGKTSLAQDATKELQEASPLKGPQFLVTKPSNEGFLLTIRYSNDRNSFEGVQATLLDLFWVGIEQPIQAPAGEWAAIDEGEETMVSQFVDRRKLPWPAFQDGTPLTANALNDATETVRAMLWLHNRTLHGWGVVEGCAVAPVPGKRKVQLEPGYALDRLGRELIVDDAVQLEIPPRVVEPGQEASKDWWVTLSYSAEIVLHSGAPSCRREGEPVRTRPRAIVRWRDPQATVDQDRLVPGMDVILATVTVEHGEVTRVSDRGRHSATPTPRPRIEGGRQVFVLDDKALWPDQNPIAYRLNVDTSSAQFVGAPRYFVTLESAPEATALNLLGTTMPVVLKSEGKPANISFDVLLPLNSMPASRGADFLGGFVQMLFWAVALALLVGFACFLPRVWNPGFAPWRGLLSAILGGTAALTATGIGMPARVQNSLTMRTGLGALFSALALLPSIASDQTWQTIWNNVPTGATSGIAGGGAGAFLIGLWYYWPQLSASIMAVSQKLFERRSPKANATTQNADQTVNTGDNTLTIAWIGIES